MNMSNHKKMYKAGKLWVAATVTAVSIGAGIAFGEQEVSADTNAAPVVVQSTYDSSREVKDQQNMVDYAQMHVDMAQKDVDTAQTRVNEVSETAKEATPQKITELESQVKEAQGQLDNTQSKAEALQQQADNYEKVMADRDKAQEAYERADDRVNVIELDMEEATKEYHNAVTPEEQNEAFIKVANLSKLFIAASEDRDNKKKIADSKAGGFEEAFLRYRVATDELNQLQPVLSKETYELQKLQNTLDQYRNIDRERQLALSDLKEKEQELQQCKNYLLEQQNKLNEIVARQKQHEHQKENSTTDKNNKSDATSETKNSGEHKTADSKENTAAMDKSNSIVSNSKQNVDSRERNQSIKVQTVTTKSTDGNKNAGSVNFNVNKDTVKQDNVSHKNEQTGEMSSHDVALPQTGNEENMTLTTLGIIMAMFGLSFMGYKKRV